MLQDHTRQCKRGGMSDVAIATPGITCPLLRQAMLTMPAAPPKGLRTHRKLMAKSWQATGLSLHIEAKSKIDCRRQKRANHCHNYVSQTPPQQLVIFYAYGETHPYYRTHQRRNQHGTDYDRNAVGVQAKRRYKNSKKSAQATDYL